MELKKLNKYDKAYLRIAKEWSLLSYCKRKQVGAIIVRDRMIISDGYNGTPSGFENCCEDEDGLPIGMCFTQRQMPFLKWPDLHKHARGQHCILRFLLVKNAANLYINPELQE